MDPENFSRKGIQGIIVFASGRGGGIRGLFSVNLLREINKFEFMTPLPRPRPPLDPRIELTEEHERTYILPYIHVIHVS